MKLKKQLFIFVFISIPVLGLCQPTDPSAPPDVPIMGIEVLLGIGGAYGVKRFLRRKKSIE